MLVFMDEANHNVARIPLNLRKLNRLLVEGSENAIELPYFSWFNFNIVGLPLPLYQYIKGSQLFFPLGNAS